MARRLAGDTIAEKLTLNHAVDGGCWLWLGAHTPSGYGQLAAGGKARAVHRLAYETFVGEIPKGLEIDHLCRVRDCINPAHLEAVTHRENMMRSRNFTAANAVKTHCYQGHPYTAATTGLTTRGGRFCRTCRNLKQRQRRAALRASS